ncbi:hypothetical protein T03_14076 [Trichinella britovi]|uniref:Uncharacterized protein n=1 Tax=Trichinella britovi TaxID=45882 RepID=A0A0V1CSQ2_TRIBR|nr:hypothetical protein T03_14076 [Trichinella britovi]
MPSLNKWTVILQHIFLLNRHAQINPADKTVSVPMNALYTRTGRKTAKPKAAVLKRRRTTATTYQTTPRTRRSMPSAIASVTGVNVKKQTPSEFSSSSSSSPSAQKNAH